MRNNDTNKVLFVSLGCDKNLVDSEEMLGALQQRGFVFTDDEEEADAAIVNTCCFIMDAQKESIDQILALAQRRTEGQLKALIGTGCMAQRYKDEVLREIPEVDAVIGTTAQDRIAPTLEEIIGTAKEAGRDGRLFVADQNLRTGTTAERIVTTGGYYSYLKIAEGCDKCCTYCVIPSIRGRYRSTPMEELISQAKSLASKGIRELILVAQETTLYGTDLYGYKALPDLLKKLSEIEGIEWIRLMYCYPEEITRQIAEAMRDNPKVLHYIDMPIQHASADILKRMGRQTDRRELEAKISKLKSLTALMEESEDIYEVHKKIFNGIPMKIETTTHPELKCDCSRERMERALISIGKKDLQEIIDEDGEAELVCHFCRSHYRFNKEELQKLLAQI